MKKLLTCLSVLVILTSCTAEARPKTGQKKEYDVYLLIGQSNMAGRGQMTDEDNLPMDGVCLLDSAGNAVPACAPLNLYSTIRKKASSQKFSLGYSFAQEMARRSDRKILLVVNARGNTGMRYWLKGAERKVFSESDGDDPKLWGKEMPEYFAEAVRRTRQAMQYGDLKGILWHQGEADAGGSSAAVYVERLEQFVSDLRESLGVTEKVPFVCGEVYRGFTKADVINKELNRAAKIIPNAHCVSSEGCPANSDNVHFSREGCILMGQRYAEFF